jgi:hypothetical protein
MNGKHVRESESWQQNGGFLLRQGHATRIRVHGGSMRGRIESGQLVSIEPATIADVRSGDVVFIMWKSSYLLHLVLRVEAEAGRVLIGNNLGKVNGWVVADAIFGKVVSVEHENL